jgi:hypothetical protein
MTPTWPNGPQRPASGSCRPTIQPTTTTRAWFILEGGKLIWIYVDPGRMHFSFVGVGGVGAALFRLSLDLPSNIFHKPTVERALQQLKEKYGLVNITYRVRDLD